MHYALFDVKREVIRTLPPPPPHSHTEKSMYTYVIEATTFIFYNYSQQNSQNPRWTPFTIQLPLYKKICFSHQNPRWPLAVKIEIRHNFGSKIKFRLGKWIPFIRFGQNLAGIYYSTIETSLRKNF